MASEWFSRSQARFSKQNAIVIENIEEMRSQVGIEDVELREAIRTLRVGDLVRLTLLPDKAPNAGETLAVRLTRIEGYHYQGKLVDEPTSARLAHLHRGASIAFSRDDIHSIANST